MEMYVVKSRFQEFAAFWRSAQTKVNFYIPGSLELRFEKDMRESVFFLSSSLDGEWDYQSEESLIAFATDVIMQLSPACKVNKIETIVKSAFKPGVKNRRIWRGVVVQNGEVTCNPHPKIEYNDYIVKLRAARNASELFNEFSDSFRYLEPHTDNYKAYSNRMRELLILSCTEIEANFSGILEVNNVKPNRKNYNTGDFAKLIQVLYLKDWGASLKLRHGCGSSYPFKDWSVEKPTQTLQWYDAYNHVKHDAFDKLCLANFNAVYNAMSALYILLIAQWGISIFEELSLHVPFICISRPIYGIADIPVAIDLDSHPQYASLAL
ncbi:hypothetical protein GIW50_12495 [Pseudomonas syringae]|uniref:Uncharacterized protein n=1 Tax=Pseudomonas syringae TaxID=317 RepID=A0A9Q3ZYZ3_PSESX|nr:hypothetical protein [Pseudomonas syringae]MCF5064944.1 hypothetical protein [Pseudomonas syringae]MCF5074911.1 hypothetical protein [Pseudomonas syringae]MCF5119222.1 hypothetical protein [Pseudomonas syringae]MCF5379060.1 hypothetical protein [Pseudomonas syringae]